MSNKGLNVVKNYSWKKSAEQYYKIVKKISED